MKALYDRNGKVVFWLASNKMVVARDGSPAYWIAENGSVYDYKGQHRGWWDGDHWRGTDGGVVTWLRGARNLGVLPPLPQLPPLPPLPALEPLRPLPQLAPLRPLKAMLWSSDRV